MSSPLSTHRSYAGFRDRLVKFTFARVLIISVLLGSAIAVNINDVDSFYAPSYLTIWGLIIATYLATVVYALWIRLGGNLSALAYTQITGDSLLAGGLVFVTGGSDSIFIFLFFLAIIPAATLRLRRGALYSAAICSLVYTLVILSQNGFVPFFSRLSLLLGSRPDAAAYSVLVHMAAFYAVAVLAGHLAETLGRFGTELELRWTDIRELKALNLHIVNSIADGLCTLDLSDRIIAFNRGAERTTGLTIDQVLAQPCSQVLPELALQLDRFRRGDLSDRQQVDLPFQRRGDQSPLILGCSVIPLRDAAGLVDGHILHFTDLTEIRHLQEAIERQERLAIIGQLSAGIAHEIRNPLASISGSLQVLKESVEGAGPESLLMEIALREIERLNCLIEDFLVYARPSRTNLVPLDLGPLLANTVSLFRQDPSVDPGVEVTLDIEPGPLAINGDPDGLRQLLWNLLRNAAQSIGERSSNPNAEPSLEATGTAESATGIATSLEVPQPCESTERSEGEPLPPVTATPSNATGALTATTGPLPGHQPDVASALGIISVVARRQQIGEVLSPWLEVILCDNGVGLSEQARAHLFEPFFTTKTGGTGLGLAIVHRIVEAHGGMITAENREDATGVRFRILLPVSSHTGTLPMEEKEEEGER
ncbi:MAG: PAS domain-containing protein [Bradymonadales bacterium]|nr:PAS domain-containing protein [Bradymonadales bacterium]